MRVAPAVGLVLALAACKRGSVQVIVDNQGGIPLEEARVLWENHDVAIGTIPVNGAHVRALEPYTEQSPQVQFTTPAGERVLLGCNITLDDDARGVLVLTVTSTSRLTCRWYPPGTSKNEPP